MINQVILIGNLTQDVENISTTGKPFAKARMATNSVWRDADGNRQESSEFHSVVAFGGLAEVLVEYGSRGRKLYVAGKLRTREYVGKDGLKRYRTEVLAENVKWLDSRPDSLRSNGEGKMSLVEEMADVIPLPA